MAITQFYETTIHDSELDLAAAFIVVPGRSLPAHLSMSEPYGLLDALGLPLAATIQPGWLVRAVASSLSQESSQFLQYWPSEGHLTQPLPPIANRYYRFAEYLTMAEVVPFEGSPLSAESVGNLITTASGVGLGAYTGFIVAGGSPLVFVLVPAGMIVFGAAAGVARALEEGLRERVLGLIRKRKE